MRFGKVSPIVFYGVLCIGCAGAISSFVASFMCSANNKSSTENSKNTTTTALGITAAVLVLFNEFIISCMIKHASRRGIFSYQLIVCFFLSEVSAAFAVSLLLVGAKCGQSCDGSRGAIFSIGGVFALKALGTGLHCYRLMTGNTSFENDENKNNDNVQIANKATVVEAVHHNV